MSQIYKQSSGGVGGGNVVGPVSSTDRSIPTWNGTGGDALYDNPSAKISSAGYMTNTNQPAFVATNTTVQSNVTGDGTTYTITFDTIQHQNGTAFNNATGVFTAPISGFYQFNFSCQPQGIAAQPVVYTTIHTTTFDYVGGLLNAANLATATQAGVGFSTLAYMNLGDTAQFQITISGGAKDVDIGGNCFCSGVLIC